MDMATAIAAAGISRTSGRDNSLCQSRSIGPFYSARCHCARLSSEEQLVLEGLTRTSNPASRRGELSSDAVSL